MMGLNAQLLLILAAEIVLLVLLACKVLWP